MAEALQQLPAWRKPEPNLASMPVEVLEQILEHVLPTTIPTKYEPFATHLISEEDCSRNQWACSFRLQSKTIKKVAEDLIIERLEVRSALGGLSAARVEIAKHKRRVCFGTEDEAGWERYFSALHDEEC
ncbi:uncharacterized protein AB675_8677 [Cyphellophora attinorum]|uniref:F-box domain-containing protein n=1 Tax=Cyphellophora attinorum TaxID=1664694 RepID=A0A0N1HZI1_9EURO|nr:uncharacterized protein AB675_8677 [Phialophora attinorum]KPI44216.1 hypothetical protein AB675_8677 [Phialophora attinorum]